MMVVVMSIVFIVVGGAFRGWLFFLAWVAFLAKVAFVAFIA